MDATIENEILKRYIRKLEALILRGSTHIPAAEAEFHHLWIESASESLSDIEGDDLH